MKILIVTDVFPPHCGGAGWSTYYLSNSLRKKGHKITIVRASKITKKEIYDGFSVHHCSHKLGMEFVHLSMEETIRTLMKTNDFDVIHAQHMRSVRAITNIEKTPKLATIRDYWPLCYNGTMFFEKQGKIALKTGYIYSLKSLWNNSGLLKYLAPLTAFYTIWRTKQAMIALKKTDKVLCVSNFVKNTLTNHIDKNKLEVLFNMVDVDKNKKEISTKKTNDILFVGKLNRGKGIDVLVKAMTGINQKLIIIGEGSFKKELELKIKKNNVDVEFKGYLDNKEVLKLMSSNIVIIPSIWNEPLGRVHLEALSVGARIITTNTGGTPDIINNKENGIIFDGSAEDLHHKIIELINKRNLQEKISKNALRTAKNKFDKKVLIPKYEEMYKKLIIND